MSKKKDTAMAAANDKEGLENVKTAGETVPGVMEQVKAKAEEAKKKKLPNVVETKERRQVSVRYDFTPAELAEIANRLTGRLCDLAQIEDEKKSVMASFTDRIKAAKLEVSKLSRNHRDGFEHRDHECFVIYDYRKKEVRFRDSATKKIVDRRPFGPGDEQRRFL